MSTVLLLEAVPEAERVVLMARLKAEHVRLEDHTGSTLHAAVIRIALKRYLQAKSSALVVSLPPMAGQPVAVRRGVLRLALGLGWAGAAPRGLKPALFTQPDDATDRFRDPNPRFWRPKGKQGSEVGVQHPAPKTDAMDRLDRLTATLGLHLAPAHPVGLGLGAWVPGAVALLVGDRPGPGWRGVRRPNWPFVSALRSGCSGWLAEQLELAGVPEHQLYWINAYGPTDEETSPDFLAALRPVVVVALGSNADAWCTKWVHDTACVQVHHPQYWKRFHHGKRYILGRELRKYLPR